MGGGGFTLPVDQVFRHCIFFGMPSGDTSSHHWPAAPGPDHAW